MKYIQLIAGNHNATYPVCGCEDRDFFQLFPNEQDIEFIEDFAKRVGDEKAREICEKLRKNLVEKREIEGLHGTLFFELEYKKRYYPTKKESEAIALPD